MKLKFYLKDPDGFVDEVGQQILDDLNVTTSGLTEEEVEALVKRRTKQIDEELEKWVEYGEYVTLELDTETKKMRVVPLSESVDNS